MPLLQAMPFITIRGGDMNIQKVRDNLKNTINGKISMQIELEYALTLTENTFVIETMLGFLKPNIAELKRILQDVEQCIGE